MMLTTKGRYAVMAMVDLAIHSKGQAICLHEIAARQHIALNYLEQIFTRLRRENLVTSLRGPGGGYLLSKAPEMIRIDEIITAADESLKITRCGEEEQKSGCMQDRTKCLTHDLWEGLGNHITHYLQGISLADICNRNIPKEPAMEKTIERLYVN